MDKKISQLLDFYLDFKKNAIEYTVVNNKVKEFVKKKGGSSIIDCYSLKLKKIDKSTYSNEAIDYLKKNKLEKFLENKIDNLKVERLIEEGILDENYVLENIEREKTFLDIKTTSMKDTFSEFLKEMEYQYSHSSILNCIKKRQVLKSELDTKRFLYYQTAKEIKQLLISNDLEQYRFRYKDDLGLVKVMYRGTSYSEDFIKYVNDNNLDVFRVVINHSDLIRSKSKKINRKELDIYKTEAYQEYLYVQFLHGVYKKNKIYMEYTKKMNEE